jgi:cell division protein FtsA
MTSDFIVGIDMGTTKVSVLIGELGPDRDLRIIGAGMCPSEGIHKGAVTDIERASERVRFAKMEAEKMAGADIRGVCAGVSGMYIKSFNSRGVIAIPTNRREVSAQDVARVTEAAASITLPSSREIIHALPQDFVVDNQEGVKDPVGMSAMRLEADVHIVTGLSMPIENLEKVLRRAGLDVIDFVFEPVATVRAVLTEEEMNMGCLFVDIGGSITGYALYYGGCVRASGVVALGGANVTSDLMIGLRTPATVAEDLKKEHGIALASLADEHRTVEVPGMGGRAGKMVRLQIIAHIIEPRCEEICTHVKEAVRADPFYRMLGGGIVLTGGGSRIHGMEGVAEQVFDLPARVGVPHELDGLSEMACREESSAAVGLMLYERDEFLARRARGRFGSNLEWMKNRIRKLSGLFEKEGGEHEIRV